MNKLVALILLLAVVAVGWCGPQKAYHSASGFSIIGPAGWKVMDPKATEKLHDTVVDQFKVKMGGANFALALFDPGGTSFTNNINVVVTNGVPAGDPTDADAEQYATALQSQLSQSGLQTKTLYAKVAPFCGHDAIEAESLITTGGQTIHDLQVIVAAGGKRFVVTCSSLEDTFSGMRPTFESAINSIKIDGDEPPSKSPLKGPLLVGVIGVLVGFGIVMAIYRIRRAS